MGCNRGPCPSYNNVKQATNAPKLFKGRIATEQGVKGTWLVGRSSGTAAVENNIAAIQKIENRITRSSSNCTFDYTPKRTKDRNRY